MFRIHRADIKFTTWFGLQYMHNGYTVIVRIPAVFQEIMQGLCGDYNMVKQDDYRLKDGTVLEYSRSGYRRTDSEYECAKSWLIKGDPGPNPNKVKEELKNCEFKNECDHMFQDDWLAHCNELLDPWPFIETCKIDYCIQPTEQVKLDLLGTVSISPDCSRR